MDSRITSTGSPIATTYTKLIRLLDRAGVRYRLIDHPPEGRTLEASALRGHPAPQAAKCMVTRVKLSKKIARYALAVIPGDRRADLGLLKTYLADEARPWRPAKPPRT